jgi:hypothetical protein
LTVAHQKSDSLPAALAEVALIDADKCAAAGDMSVSWWLAEVAARRAPQPAIRRPRCTRWRAQEVADFWRRFVEVGADPEQAQSVASARKASDAARAKRDASRAQPPGRKRGEPEHV